MILVTGATGLVGSHLIQALTSAGKTVKALYRKSIPQIPGAEQVQWVQADILDVVALEAAMEGVTHVYHCAAIVSFSPKQKAALHQTNIEGTANVVNACLQAGVQKLLYVSSVAALGRIRESGMVDESMNWSEETSNSEYGKSKFLAEMEVWRGIGEGLQAVMINPVIILGAGDWNKGSSEIFQSAYNEFPWYTSGMSGFVDVVDVVKAAIVLMESSVTAQRFIISGENRYYRDIFTMIAQGFGKKPPHRKVTPILAEIVWRLEAIKGWITGKDPLLTKETARTAQAVVRFDNNKLLKQFPDFQYTSLENSIKRICGELTARHGL